ncbi:MAG: hypothetical protein QM765_35100 [Myxococcales bacterium]
MTLAVSTAALALALSAAAPGPATAAAPAAPSAVAAPAPSPASPLEARQLAGKKAWDELYLRFSAAKAADYKEADRKAIAAVLMDASKALADDPALALACAEKSAELAPSLEAWLAAGDLYLKLKQVAAAATAYEKAVLLAPTSGRALVARADLAMQEGEPELAVDLYSKVPPKAPEAKTAQEKLAKAKAAAQERSKAVAELTQADRKIVVGAKPSKPAEDPRAVSNEAVCSESMRALCTLVRRCMPQDPGGSSCEDEVSEQCAKLAGNTKVTRKDLDACVAGLNKASCEKFLGGVRGVSEVSASCKTVEDALDKLRDAPGPMTNE